MDTFKELKQLWENEALIEKQEGIIRFRLTPEIYKNKKKNGEIEILNNIIGVDNE